MQDNNMNASNQQQREQLAQEWDQYLNDFDDNQLPGIEGKAALQKEEIKALTL